MKAVENFISSTEVFTGQPVSKTITAKLVPVGKTRENIDKMNILEMDKQREEAFVRVKKYIDRIHKDFIEDCLTSQDKGFGTAIHSYEFNKLYELRVNLKNLTGKERKDVQKQIKLEENRLRVLISKYFEFNPKYKKLFNIELFKELLPAYCSEEEMKDVNLFDGYTSYFKRFNDTREMLYSSE